MTNVVLPYSLDLEIINGHAFLSHPKLLDYSQTCLVAGNDGDLDAVQAQVLERELQQQDDRFWSQALPSMVLINPVADHAALKRSTQNIAQMNLTGQRSISQEDPEGICRTEVALTRPGCTTGTECTLVH